MSDYSMRWSGVLGCHQVTHSRSAEIIAHVWPVGKVSWFRPLVSVEDMDAVVEFAKEKAAYADQDARAARMADEFQAYAAVWIQAHPGTEAHVTLHVRDEHRFNTIRPRSRRVEAQLSEGRARVV